MVGQAYPGWEINPFTSKKSEKCYNTNQMNIRVYKIPFIILTAFMAVFLYPHFVFAHPGNTASDGCHYCRTNCDKWGVPWNERHCHGGGEVKPVEVPQAIPIVISPSPSPVYIIPISPSPILSPSPLKSVSPSPSSSESPSPSPKLSPSPLTSPSVQQVISSPEIKGATTENKPPSTAAAITGFGILGALGWGSYKLIKKIIIWAKNI